MAQSEKNAAETIAAAPVEQVVQGDTISKLAGMNDAELAQVLGYAQQLEDSKTQIADLNELQGKGREYAEGRVRDMLTPRIYDLRYTLEEAQRKNARKDAKTAMADCGCDSVLD